MSSRRNLITDVSGLMVGNATDEKAMTGVTALICEQQFVGAVDIRGGAPGARETDVLAPENLVGGLHAIVLAGGSVFGLAAADGAANYLSRNGTGLSLSGKGPAIPIVPAAILHDLGNAGDKEWGDEAPYRNLGAQATASASTSFEIGRIGAGRGAMAGKDVGGLGSASFTLECGVSVGALVAINPVGSVYIGDSNCFHAWPWEIDGEFGGRTPPAGDFKGPFPPRSRLGSGPVSPGANTTLAIIATSADLTNVEAKRVAIMAHDGIARAIRPAHTMLDGDIVFAVATAKTPVAGDNPLARAIKVTEIGASAADCLARAIARGVFAAESQP